MILSKMILQTLKELGPMTVEELSERLGYPVPVLRSSVSQLGDSISSDGEKIEAVVTW